MAVEILSAPQITPIILVDDDGYQMYTQYNLDEQVSRFVQKEEPGWRKMAAMHGMDGLNAQSRRKARTANFILSTLSGNSVQPLRVYRDTGGKVTNIQIPKFSKQCESTWWDLVNINLDLQNRVAAMALGCPSAINFCIEAYRIMSLHQEKGKIDSPEYEAAWQPMVQRFGELHPVQREAVLPVVSAIGRYFRGGYSY